MDESQDKSRELPEQEPEPQQQSGEPAEAPAVASAAAPREEVEEAATKETGPAPLSEREYKRLNRREVLKLTPLVLLGAFAIPKLQETLLEKGVALSDWASN